MKSGHIVKECTRCGRRTFARAQYITICRGESSPNPHPARAMTGVIDRTARLQVRRDYRDSSSRSEP
jgi:hypothetical protein